MQYTTSLIASQAFVEYFGTWASDFLSSFSRVVQGAIQYGQRRPIVLVFAVVVVLLLLRVTRSRS